MQNKYRSSSYFTDQDDPQSSSETRPDSPLSGDDSRATATAPSPKKSRRSIQKRVVHVPIGEGDGSRSKGEAYPPSDSWAWRKYGQKPIKGSPYPRGYHRCSSSKGCPARKQVERNRVDPTKLIITYACEHNHPLPTSKHHHNHHQAAAATAAVAAAATTTTQSTDNVAAASPTTTTTSTDADIGGEPTSPTLIVEYNPSNPFGDPPQLEFVGDALILGNSGVEYSWISDMSFTTPSTSLVGPTCDYVDMSAAAFPMREEDESLFGDLDELPECSVVFRRSQGSIERCTTAAPICGSTG